MLTMKNIVIYGGSIYIGTTLYYLKQDQDKYDLKFSFSRTASKIAGFISNIYVPIFLREFLFGTFAKQYNVILDDMVLPMKEYNNFGEFFTRKVKPREVNQNQNILVAPADSKILAISEVNGDSNLLVKDIKYSMGELLTGKNGYKIEGELLESMKKAEKKEGSKLYSIIFYLNPGDYHRYHSPCEFFVKRSNHIQGHLLPVKESYISKTPKVYETNERISLFGTWLNQWLMSVVIVGATNVGSMTLSFDPEISTNKKINLDKFKRFSIREYYIKNEEQVAEKKQEEIKMQIFKKELEEFGEKDVHFELNKQKSSDLQIPNHYQRDNRGIKLQKQEEMGMFKLGSTLVVIFEVQGNLKWLVKEGDKVRFGQPVLEIVKEQDEQNKINKN